MGLVGIANSETPGVPSPHEALPMSKLSASYSIHDDFVLLTNLQSLYKNTRYASTSMPTILSR